MRQYELVLVLRSSLVEAKRNKLLETVKSWLREVRVAKESEWGQKPLAYAIKKENSGFYVDYLLDSDLPSVGIGTGGIPKDFEKRIMGNEDILRHLLVRKK
ncbi:hypothetical protein LBMAG33_3820 [Candidatus Levyibacteriota bacterium]|nr:30S ribosomal protein S6 [Candidatus Levybacteria bacterium]MSU25986.1 30S ribosomal protein S6 [Candidatus Levybacteria bacterium]GDX62072.1 hypothetical protein LBMAG33_3820 [Candidatus Levybacteria bacterium]